MNNNRRVFMALFALLLLPLFALAQSTQSSCPNLSRNLSLGSRGADIIGLQDFLIAQTLLAQGNDTGYFGRLTKAGAIGFQTQQSLPATGLVGPLTRAAIAKVCGGSQTVKQTTNTNQETVQSVTSTFSALPETGVVPFYVNFAFKDPTSGRSYTVDFGDGSSGVLGFASFLIPDRSGFPSTPPAYIGQHTYTSGGTHVAKVKDASGNIRGTVTITAEQHPATIPFTIPGTITLSLRQIGIRHNGTDGTSDDVLELEEIDTDSNGLQAAGLFWRHGTASCGTGGCAELGSETNGIIVGASFVKLYLNAPQPNTLGEDQSWRTPDGYLITLTALTASTATFQISQ